MFKFCMYNDVYFFVPFSHRSPSNPGVHIQCAISSSIHVALLKQVISSHFVLWVVGKIVSLPTILPCGPTNNGRRVVKSVINFKFRILNATEKYDFRF